MASSTTLSNMKFLHGVAYFIGMTWALAYWWTPEQIGVTHDLTKYETIPDYYDIDIVVEKKTNQEILEAGMHPDSVARFPRFMLVEKDEHQKLLLAENAYLGVLNGYHVDLPEGSGEFEPESFAQPDYDLGDIVEFSVENKGNAKIVSVDRIYHGDMYFFSTYKVEDGKITPLTYRHYNDFQGFSQTVGPGLFALIIALITLPLFHKLLWMTGYYEKLVGPIDAITSTGSGEIEKQDDVEDTDMSGIDHQGEEKGDERKRWFHVIHLKAIFSGLFLDMLVSMGMMLVLGIGASMITDGELLQEVSMMIFTGFIGTIVGGYVATRRSGHASYVNAIALSVPWLIMKHVQVQSGSMDLQWWLELLFRVYPLPAALAGAYIAISLMKKSKEGTGNKGQKKLSSPAELDKGMGNDGQEETFSPGEQYVKLVFSVPVLTLALYGASESLYGAYVDFSTHVGLGLSFALIWVAVLLPALDVTQKSIRCLVRRAKISSVIMSSGSRNGLSVILFFAAVLIIAATSREAYSKRAKFTEVIGVAAQVKTDVSEYHRLHKRFPVRGGLPALEGVANRSEMIHSFYYENGGAFIITVPKKYQFGSTIKFTPTVVNDAVQWDCTGGDVKIWVRPANCRR